MKFEKLIQELSLEEYQDFIRQYAKGRESFRTEFMLWFASQSKKDHLHKDYEKLLKKTIAKHERQGFLDYRATFALARDVNKLLQTAIEQFTRQKFYEAYSISRAVLTTMIEVMAYSDDSGDNIGSTISDAIELIESIIIDDNVSPDLIEQVFEFLMEESSNRIYFDFGDYGYNLVGLLSSLAIRLNETDKFLQFLDKCISMPKETIGDYTLDFFKLQKIEFLKDSGRVEESKEMIHQNMDMVKVREEEVEKAIEMKDYWMAKKLIAEGINIAKENDHPGTINSWKEKLLEIAILENDVEKIRSYSRYFAFDDEFSREHYLQWKKTYPIEEWKKIIDDYIEGKTKEFNRRALKNKTNMGFFHGESLLESLAPVYIEERRWDRLWDLVSRENDFDTVWEYHDYLVKIYPDELLEVYSKYIEELGDKADKRSVYAELLRKMKIISKDIKGGRQRMETIVQTLITRYPRRPALIDELKKF